MSALKRISQQFSMSKRARLTSGGEVETNDQATSPPVHLLALPIPTLNITPASPQFSFEGDFAPVSMHDYDRPVTVEEEKEKSQSRKEFDRSQSTDYYEKQEPDWHPTPSPSLSSTDVLPLTSTTTSTVDLSQDSSPPRNRRQSFPRFLHPDDLPPLAALPPLDENDPTSQRRHKRKLVLIRLLVVLTIVATAIGLGVGLSGKPNHSPTSSNVGGVAPSGRAVDDVLHGTSDSTAGPTRSWSGRGGNVASLSALATPTTSSAPSSSNAVIRPVNANLGVPKQGLGGVLLHNNDNHNAHFKNGTSSSRQRRRLRRFGKATVAGWR